MHHIILPVIDGIIKSLHVMTLKSRTAIIAITAIMHAVIFAPASDAASIGMKIKKAAASLSLDDIYLQFPFFFCR